MAKNPFLDAAKKKLDEQSAKTDAVSQQRDAVRASATAQNKFYDSNLLALVDQLKALPQKNGREFVVTQREIVNADIEPKLVLALEYTGGVYKRNTDRGGRTLGPGLKDAVTLVMDRFEDADNFSMRIIRQDSYIADDNKRHKVFNVTNVDTMLGVLGDFVASVAPDRIAELGGPATKAAPKTDITGFDNDLWDAVEKVISEEPKQPARKPPAARGRRR